MKRAFDQKYFIEMCRLIGSRPKLCPRTKNDLADLDLSEFL